MNAVDWIFILGTWLKIGCVIGVILFLVSYTVYAERRISAMIQDRLGPNRVGIPFTKISLWGLGQPIADAIKLLLKEEFTPAGVRKFYFNLAPILAVSPALIVACVIPFGSEIDLRPVAVWAGTFWNLSAETIEACNMSGVIADLDVGLLFVFAIAAMSIYGIILAGWASNSKYPFLGSIRASGQLISYELCMGLSAIPIFLVVGDWNLSSIVQYQIQNGWLALPFYPLSPISLFLWIPLFISFVMFLISAFAETNRLPFDLPECESELVSGYHTEYSSMKFALFFLGEYAALIVVSAVMITLYFGGWSLPLPWFNGQAVPLDWPIFAGHSMPWWFGFVHAAVLVAKIALMLFFFIWVRWTLPRFRYDQLMNLSWKALIPLALVNIFVTAFFVAFLGNMIAR
ncbi:MAG: complex I subunit 1/NuoH family protein [Verrucomicrobiota bacterium]